MNMKNIEKCIAGALYGIFLENTLDKIHNWQAHFEKDYLNYCRTGCENCYKWNAYCRSEKDVSPYEKFIKKK